MKPQNYIKEPPVKHDLLGSIEERNVLRIVAYFIFTLDRDVKLKIIGIDSKLAKWVKK